MKEKKRLSSGKWLVLFLVTALLIAAAVPVFNILTDPYGAFGDPVLQWWTYDMTMNPRLAKFQYLEKYHDNYDSYIVGASGSSILSVEALNEYLDAKFYNTFFYNSDIEGFRQTAEYLLDRYEVKNLVLNLSLTAAADTPVADGPLTQTQHWKVDGSSPLAFWRKYLFVSPLEGIQKLQYKSGDDYMPHGYKNITPETGEYDRRLRDAENIRDLKNYLSRSAYEKFNHYAEHVYGLPFLEDCVEAVRAIKERCDEKGVRLIVICQPMYRDNLLYYSWADRERFCNRLASVTDYWDFTSSSVSWDPRYFYDLSHARNAVGRMMLARIFDDDSIYVPEDLGRYVKQGTYPSAQAAPAPDKADYCCALPILRYSRLTEGEPKEEGQVSAARFAEQLDALAAAGYTPVTIRQMRDYVEKGADLPEKPVLITFDGGWEDTWRLAYPILQARGWQATVFVSGADLEGGSPDKLSHAQALEMTGSGLITLGSMGYDLGEAGADTPEALTEDARRMRDLLGESAGFFSYPGSRSDNFRLLVLMENGTDASVAGRGSCTTLIRGLPQSLLNMPRRFVDQSLSGEDLVRELDARTAASD